MYKQRHGKDFYDNPARSFTGMMTLLDAINRAGSTDPRAIRKALVATSIPGDQLVMTWDGIKFDETGQNVHVKGIIIQLQGGKWSPSTRSKWPRRTCSTRSRRGRTASLTAEIFLQAAIGGVLMGCVYALVAAGLSLIFRADGARQLRPRRVPDARHVRRVLRLVAGGLDPVVAAPLAAVALGAVGWLTYHGLIRRVLAAPMLAQIFATFGLAVFLRNGAQFAFGVDFLTVQDPWLAGRVSLGGLFLRLPQSAPAWPRSSPSGPLSSSRARRPGWRSPRRRRTVRPRRSWASTPSACSRSAG